MVALPGHVDFKMGSPAGEDGRVQSEAQRGKRIPRSFAIATKLTTNAQFSRLDRGKKHVENLPPHFNEGDKPVVRATWFEAAAYCNWLSEMEGLGESERCYIVDKKNGTVVGVHANYLERKGYRLPTEAEVEFANRALTTTARFYGETEDLLGDYAWYQKNSGERTQPVGTRKPNDFGLFDMQGNAFTWCHDRVDSSVRQQVADVSDKEEVINMSGKRALRGGAFYFMAISLRAARSHDDVPTMQGLYYGFRIARTLN
jgi:formylglycine-generating enzyme required for sulfatase activity